MHQVVATDSISNKIHSYKPHFRAIRSDTEKTFVETLQTSKETAKNVLRELEAIFEGIFNISIFKPQ